MFRDLKAEEIECRVALAKEKGVSLLLYKDARCDQNILDETVGAMNWQRQHTRDNANCIVSIWDKEKQQWIGKEDTGTESNTEKEKGLASDSFKRACFNWGIGRELYTAPLIWIQAEECMKLKQDERSGKWQCKDIFEVASIKIENKRIVALTIINAKNGRVVFKWSENQPVTQPAAPEKKPEQPKQEQPKPKFTPPDLAFRCEDCGAELKRYIGKNGEEVGLRKHAEGSKNRFGRVLCLDCINKMKAQENA